MKKLIYYVLCILITLSLCSCNTEDQEFVSSEVHLINAAPDDIEKFFGEIREYSSTFDSDLKLISVYIDYSSSGQMEAMHIGFDAKATESKAERWLDLRYDPMQKGINYTRYFIGSIQGFWVDENEKLDISVWNTDFTSAFYKAKEEFKKRSDEPIEEISVECEETEWKYTFYINEGLPWPDGATMETDRVGLMFMGRKTVSVSVNVCE